MFYCKKLKRYINLVLFYVGIMIDQPEKILGTIFARENSGYRAKHRQSYDFKDIAKQLPSHKDCRIKFSKGIDVYSCKKYLNQNFMEARYSPECIKNNRRVLDKIFKLTIEIQKIKSKNIFDNDIAGKLIRTKAIKILKSINLIEILLNSYQIQLVLKILVN